MAIELSVLTVASTALSSTKQNTHATQLVCLIALFYCLQHYFYGNSQIVFVYVCIGMVAFRPYSLLVVIILLTTTITIVLFVYFWINKSSYLNVNVTDRNYTHMETFRRSEETHSQSYHQIISEESYEPQSERLSNDILTTIQHFYALDFFDTREVSYLDLLLMNESRLFRTQNLQPEIQLLPNNLMFPFSSVSD